MAINNNTEANSVDKVLGNHLTTLGLAPDQYDMNFTIFNELTKSNVRPDCCVKIGNKYGVVFENKKDYKDLQGAKIQWLQYLALLQKNNALCRRCVLIVTDGLSFDAGQYEIVDNKIAFVQSLSLDAWFQISLDWMRRYAWDEAVEVKKAITSWDKAELKKTFDKINNYLRDKGLGKDSRLHITSAMLFLKLIKENDDLFQIMDHKKVAKIQDSLEALKSTKNEATIVACFQKLAEMYEWDFNFNLKEYEDKNIIKGLFEIVDELHLANYDLDIKWEAFEYFINYGNTSSDMGEYFTPRHIVNFMIRLLDHTFAQRREKRFGKTYFDPTCGTGWFLIKIFQRVHQELKDEKKDTPEIIQKLKAETVFGNELNLRSSEIAKMNMILTGDGHSNIDQGDFLEEKKNRVWRYDVTIGNPPFGKNMEVHFVDGFLDDVKEWWYSLIVVPEGILFNKSNEFTRLRKRLLNHWRILSIISLPKWVFFPYSWVKTNIILREKKSLDKTYDIEMFEIRNDGFTLDNHRRPLLTSDLELYFTNKQTLVDKGQIYIINTNQIHDVHELARLESVLISLSDTINQTNTLIKTIKKQIPQITDDTAKQIKLKKVQDLQEKLIDVKWEEQNIKNKIREFDVNLLVSTYYPKWEKSSNIERVELSSIGTFINGYAFSPKTRQISGFPIVRIQNLTDTDKKFNYTDGINIPEKYKIKDGDILVSWSATLWLFEWNRWDAYLNQHIFKASLDQSKILPQYFLSIEKKLVSLMQGWTHGNTMAHITKDKFESIEIPLPPLEEQQKIINKVKSMRSLIAEKEKEIKDIENSIDWIIEDVWGI